MIDDILKGFGLMLLTGGLLSVAGVLLKAIVRSFGR